MKRSLIAALLLAAGAAAASDSFVVGINTVSFHSEPGYETVTPGLYVRSTGDWFAEAGVFRNSFGFTTYHLAGGYSYQWQQFDASLAIGASYGYRARQQWVDQDGSYLYTTYGPPKIKPLVMPSVGYRLNDWGARLFVLPPLGSTNVDGVKQSWCFSIAIERYF